MGDIGRMPSRVMRLLDDAAVNCILMNRLRNEAMVLPAHRASATLSPVLNVPRCTCFLFDVSPAVASRCGFGRPLLAQLPLDCTVLNAVEDGCMIDGVVDCIARNHVRVTGERFWEVMSSDVSFDDAC